MKSSAARWAAVLLLPVLVLAGCASEGSSDDDSSPSSGVEASGSFGEKPTLTIPEGEAPTTLIVETLSEGDGEEVATGDTLIANYLGQTWEPKDGEANVFDNSYDRNQPVGFPIGEGKVIQGWDDGLVGKTVGSRVLLTIPAGQAYGESPSDSNELAGQTLVFVVDIVDSLASDTSAEGEVVAPTGTGLPKVESASGAKPSITSVDGVKPGDEPRSALLIKGTGDPIDGDKVLAMQILQADASTGQVGQDTWSQGLQVVPASQVLEVADALTGQPVGSRAVVVTPASDGQQGVVLVLDIVAQY